MDTAATGLFPTKTEVSLDQEGLVENNEQLNRIQSFVNTFIQNVVINHRRIQESLADVVQKICSANGNYYERFTEQIHSLTDAGKVVDETFISKVRLMTDLMEEINKKIFESANQLIDISVLGSNQSVNAVIEIMDAAALERPNEIPTIKNRFVLIRNFINSTIDDIAANQELIQSLLTDSTQKNKQLNSSFYQMALSVCDPALKCTAHLIEKCSLSSQMTDSITKHTYENTSKLLRLIHRVNEHILTVNKHLIEILMKY